MATTYVSSHGIIRPRQTAKTEDQSTDLSTRRKILLLPFGLIGVILSIFPFSLIVLLLIAMLF